MVTVKVLLSEEELRTEFLEALKRRELPEKFFYWLPTSVAAWLNLCRSPRYGNFFRSLGLVEEHAHAIAGALKVKNPTLVSLGCGQGVKEQHLLRALLETGESVRYRPVDASLGLLELACAAGETAGVETMGLKADITRLDHLQKIAEESRGAQRVYTMLGNTLGSGDPDSALRRLTLLMERGDYLVLDGEMFSEAESLARYDNPDNREFAWAPLREVGITEAEGELVFRLEKDAGRAGLHRVSKAFHVTRPFSRFICGERVEFRPGDVVAMSPSYKYEPRTLMGFLEEAGLSVEKTFYSKDGGYVLAVTRLA